MTTSPFWNEHYVVLERPESSEFASERVAPGTDEHRVVPAVCPTHEAMRPDRCGVGVSLGTIQEISGRFHPPDRAHTRKELDALILQDYKHVAKDSHSYTGANHFLAYLHSEQRSLAEVTKWDLQDWARTPMASGRGRGNMPSDRVFRGAKGLCAFAAQVGYIDAARANAIAECSRHHIDANVLRSQLQNPMLTSVERISHIHLHYQMTEKNTNRQAGANAFLAYLQNQNKSLAEVSTSDLGRWALMPLRRGHFKSKLPNSDAFEGAKQLCALAAEVGSIQAQRAIDFSTYLRPQFDLGTLRTILQNPELTRREHENHIRLHFQSVDKQHEHQAGASAMLRHLEGEGISLAEVSTSVLEQWALTPVTTRKGKFKVPSRRAFDGAQMLCALAGEVGYIDVQRAKQLVEFKRPQFGVDSLRTLLQNPALTIKERESHIRLNYQSSENSANRHAGAVSFLAFLENAKIALSAVSSSDLRQWALTPMKGTGNLPEQQAFEGAKALCALAAEVGHLDGQRAQELATCKRPHFEVDFLKTLLQNPELTRKECEYKIHLTYQSIDQEPVRQGGGKGIMEYLEKQGRLLSEVTTSDLQQWALTPLTTGKAKGRLPNAASFEGAKALCALAAEVGYIDAQRAQDLARCPRPQGDIDSLRRLIQNPELTRKERDYHISLHFQMAEKNGFRQVGASRFMAYLESQDLSLAEASKSHLERWALTPIAIGIRKQQLPSSLAFQGARAFCALAAEVGLIDAPRAQALATCARPRFDVYSLRMVLQNPTLTRKEREVQICLNYQSSAKNLHSVNGANEFLAFLDSQQSSLAEVTKRDLEEWALWPLSTDQAKRILPSQGAFEGAKALCAVAAGVGYIDPRTAKDIADCRRPYLERDLLRCVLENPALSPEEREHEICLNSQSTEKNAHKQSGMNRFLAYLQHQGSSLADVTKRDLEQWALTQFTSGPGKGSYPNQRAIQGAKVLCARAAEVGYIDEQRATDIAGCTVPQPGGRLTRTVHTSEAGLHVAESSGAMLERVNKRLRTDDQGASTSLFHSFAFPQSDALFRELALSPPSLLDPNQHAPSPQTGGTLSLIDELESLEDLLGSSGHLW